MSFYSYCLWYLFMTCLLFTDEIVTAACTTTTDTKCQCKPGTFCVPDQACEVCKRCARWVFHGAWLGFYLKGVCKVCVCVWGVVLHIKVCLQSSGRSGACVEGRWIRDWRLSCIVGNVGIRLLMRKKKLWFRSLLYFKVSKCIYSQILIKQTGFLCVNITGYSWIISFISLHNRRCKPGEEEVRKCTPFSNTVCRKRDPSPTVSLPAAPTTPTPAPSVDIGKFAVLYKPTALTLLSLFHSSDSSRFIVFSHSYLHLPGCCHHHPRHWPGSVVVPDQAASMWSAVYVDIMLLLCDAVVLIRAVFLICSSFHQV